MKVSTVLPVLFARTRCSCGQSPVSKLCYIGELWIVDCVKHSVLSSHTYLHDLDTKGITR